MRDGVATEGGAAVPADDDDGGSSVATAAGSPAIDSSSTVSAGRTVGPLAALVGAGGERPVLSPRTRARDGRKGVAFAAVGPLSAGQGS